MAMLGKSGKSKWYRGVVVVWWKSVVPRVRLRLRFHSRSTAAKVRYRSSTLGMF